MATKRRRRGRVILFLLITVGAVALFLFSRRIVWRPGKVVEHAAGGGYTDTDDPSALIEDHRRYKVKTWSFPLARFELRIEDASMTTALDTVLDSVDAELVVNGGFFGADTKPVGLAMSNGAVLSRLSKTMSGGVLTSDGDEAQLFAAETFELPDGGNFAIQCKPRLVVDKASNIKSDDGKRAERTALCTRDGGKVVDVFIIRGSDDGESPGPSLYALARYLVSVGCEAALNLDGGPSTGVAWREDGGVKLLPPRAPIRHVVTFRERR